MLHTKPLGFFGVYEPVEILDTDEGKAFLAKLPEGTAPHIELIRAKLIPATAAAPARWVQDKLSRAIEMVKHCADGPAFWRDAPDVEIEDYKRRLTLHYQYGVLHRIGGERDWAFWEIATRRQHWHYGAMVSEDVHPYIAEQLAIADAAIAAAQ